jgi:acyl-coenzyme A synthetase/AMP-(fatty) acid ligase
MWNFDENLNKIAVVDENDVKFTYSDLKDHGKDLTEHIPERCLVFNVCSNSYGSLIGYTSFLNNRIVPLMLNSELPDDMFLKLVEKYRPAFIHAPSCKTYKGLELVSVFTHFNYTLYKTNYSQKTPMHEELSLLLSTSGSTGSPKLVKQSYKNISSNTAAIIKYLNIRESDRAISSLPMSYTYGISVINTHLSVGASIVLTEFSILQKEFWEKLKYQMVTNLSGVPYTYEMLDRLRFYRMKLPSLKLLTQAGGKLSLDLHQKFAQYAIEQGKRFVVMYGQTEATARMAYLSPEKSLEKCGSIGVAIPGGRFELVDEAEKVVTSPGSVGELKFYGDNVSLGYADCLEDLSVGDENGGVLFTGDLAKVDDEGFYYIVGRKSRIVKVFGVRVNLDDTERLIKEEFQNVICAVIGKDDMIQVFIEDSSLKVDIAKFITQKIGLNNRTIKINVLEEIQKTESGKIKYASLVVGEA